jgi:hypothetical protein
MAGGRGPAPVGVAGVMDHRTAILFWLFAALIGVVIVARANVAGPERQGARGRSAPIRAAWSTGKNVGAPWLIRHPNGVDLHKRHRQ